MKRILISLLFLASAADVSAPAPPPTETEVRAQAIISLLIQQRDEAMNQIAVIAVELAKAKARIEALEAQAKEPKK
jgi:hypothetical protein